MAHETLTVDQFTMGDVEYVITATHGITRDTWVIEATANGQPVPVASTGIKRRRAIGQHQIHGTVKQVSTHLVARHMDRAFVSVFGEG